jgi:hypothetical protein
MFGPIFMLTAPCGPEGVLGVRVGKHLMRETVNFDSTVEKIRKIDLVSCFLGESPLTIKIIDAALLKMEQP